MIPPDELPADAMFEQFLDGDETLNAALSEMGEGAAAGAAARGNDVLSAGLHFVKKLRDMEE